MPDDTLTIATFNVNSVRKRMETLIEWLAFNDPDILCLQETKVQDKDFPLDDFLDAGYHVAFCGMKSYNGVATISKMKPTEVIAGFDDEPTDGPRLLRTRFGPLVVLNAYVPQGREVGSEHYAYKLEWLRRFGALLEECYSPDEALLWTGDLNVAPTDDDVHSPKELRGHVCFNDELTGVFNEVLEWGLVDVFRKHKPGGGEFTFFDYRSPQTLERNRGWRIDHLLATKPLADRSIDSFVDRDPRAGANPSDHTPLVGVFQR